MGELLHDGCLTGELSNTLCTMPFVPISTVICATRSFYRPYRDTNRVRVDGLSVWGPKQVDIVLRSKRVVNHLGSARTRLSFFEQYMCHRDGRTSILHSTQRTPSTTRQHAIATFFFSECRLICFLLVCLSTRLEEHLSSLT